MELLNKLSLFQNYTTLNIFQTVYKKSWIQKFWYIWKRTLLSLQLTNFSFNILRRALLLREFKMIINIIFILKLTISPQCYIWYLRSKYYIIIGSNNNNLCRLKTHPISTKCSLSILVDFKLKEYLSWLSCQLQKSAYYVSTSYYHIRYWENPQIT